MNLKLIISTILMADISEIVIESMASAGRMHAVESGKVLEARTMIAFGGNGPLHAARVARRAGVTRVLVPSEAGGFGTCRIEWIFDEIVDQATPIVQAGAPKQRLTRRRSAFLRYYGAIP